MNIDEFVMSFIRYVLAALFCRVCLKFVDKSEASEWKVAFLVLAFGFLGLLFWETYKLSMAIWEWSLSL